MQTGIYVNLTAIIALNKWFIKFYALSLNAWKVKFQPYETKELKSSPH